MDSTWIPHRFHIDSTWNLHGVYVESMQIPHGFHVESMWNAPNISTYFQVRFKKLISYKTFDQLTT